MTVGERQVVTLRLRRAFWVEVKVQAAREEKSAQRWCEEALELVLRRVLERA